MRLLLVEDDAALREILMKRLIQEGYAVDACGDGNTGLEYALDVAYDGIVLDIMLPGIDGLTLLSQIRARGITSSVLLLTARDAVGDRVRGLDCGADDYLTKPFAFEELCARFPSRPAWSSSFDAEVWLFGSLVLRAWPPTTHRLSTMASPGEVV